VEDGTWTRQAIPIGYGRLDTVDFSTEITGMQGVYSSVFMRREFEVAPGEIPGKLVFRYVVDDGCVVFINGQEVFRTANMGGGPLTIADLASGSGNEGEWLKTEIDGVLAQVGVGTNVMAINAFNGTLGSSDFGVSAVLLRPEADPTNEPRPSPGIGNTVFSEMAPPAIRQVDHSPKEPPAGEIVVVTAKVTDSDGVATGRLETQAVAPGAYIPAFLAKTTSDLVANPTSPRTPNPAYEQNWITQEMRDDGQAPDEFAGEFAGDGVYSVGVAGNPNRPLVRYRITVEDGGEGSLSR